jgi:hypothetical protein
VTAFSPLPQPPARPWFPRPRRPAVQVARSLGRGCGQRGTLLADKCTYTIVGWMHRCAALPRGASMPPRGSLGGYAERSSSEPWPGSVCCRSRTDAAVCGRQRRCPIPQAAPPDTLARRRGHPLGRWRVEGDTTRRSVYVHPLRLDVRDALAPTVTAGDGEIAAARIARLDSFGRPVLAARWPGRFCGVSRSW